MRSSTRHSLLGAVFGLCIAATLVFVSVLLVEPADAQTYMLWWEPNYVEVLESDREVLLTLRKNGPGHAHYQTEDGSCTGDGRLVSNCTPSAQAPDDYQAVSGDEVFSGDSSKTIRIPIVDDNLDEGSEVFSVFAYGEDRNAMAVVRILDHPKPSPEGSSSPGGSSQQTSGSQAGSPARQPSQPSAVPDSPGSTDGSNQSAEVNSDDPTPGEPGPEGKVERFAQAAGNDTGSSFLTLATLRTLLIVTIAAVAFGLKKWLGRRWALGTRRES